MPSQSTTYKLFIASPSDVQEERQIVRDVVLDWNASFADSTEAMIHAIGWETHSFPDSGDSPQAILNRQLLRDVDILVAIFWSRVGTATPDALSGTVEEINRHTATHKPAMIYFSEKDFPQGADLDQVRAVRELRSSLQHGALIDTFKTNQEFRQKFTRHLAAKMAEYLKSATGAPVPAIRESSSIQINANSRQSMPDSREKRFALWRDAADAGKISAPSLHHRYLDKVVEDLGTFYLTEHDQEQLENELLNKLDAWTPIRDELLESVGYFAGDSPEKAAASITCALERLLPCKFPPDPLPTQGWPSIACESVAIFLYELYLRIVAQLLSFNAYSTLAVLLKQYYVVPRNERGLWGSNARFMIFAADSRILGGRNERLKLNRYSLLADILKDRCGNSASTFQSVREADLILALRSIVHPISYIWWFPRTLIYSTRTVLPFFARAEQKQHFNTLCSIVDVANKEALEQALEATPERRILFSNSRSPTSISALINLQKLDSVA